MSCEAGGLGSWVGGCVHWEGSGLACSAQGERPGGRARGGVSPHSREDDRGSWIGSP